MDASNMTPAQKRGVLACWEVLNKSHDCAGDAAVFAASMTGHTFDVNADDSRDAMGRIPTGIADYESMSDTDGEDQGVTLMLEHLKGKGHRKLGNASSLRVKYQRAKEAKLVAAGAGLAGVAVASEEGDSEGRDGDGDDDS